MKALITVRPEGMPIEDQLEMMGTDCDFGFNKAFVQIRPVGYGVGMDVSLDEAISMGLSIMDLRLCAQEPRIFDVQLVKTLQPKEDLCGAKNSQSTCSA